MSNEHVVRLGSDAGGNPVYLPLDGAARPTRQNITQFQPKVVTGVPTLDDQTVRSDLSFSDFPGGLGRYRLHMREEGVQRYWYGSGGVDTRFPGITTLGPNSSAQTITGALATQTGGWWMSDVTSGHSRAFMSGTSVLLGGLVQTDGTGGFVSPSYGTALPAALSGQPAAFDSFYFFPHHASANYSYSSLLGVATSSGGKQFKFMAPTNNLLYGYDAQLVTLWASSSPNSALAGAWTQVMTFNNVLVDPPQALVAGYSGDGYPCLFLITGSYVYQIDPYNQTCNLVLSFPAELDSNMNIITRDALVWQRTRNLYVTDDRNLWEIGAGTIRNITPFADDGLPNLASAYPMTGQVYSLFSMGNWLGCVIREALGAMSSVLLYDERGWHPLVVAAGTGERFHRALAQENAIYVWANSGSANKVYQFYAPDSVQAQWTKEVGVRAHVSSGILITAWADNDMPGIAKVADVVEVLGFNLSATETVKVEYQTDSTYSDDTWTVLGTTATVGEGRTIFSFNDGSGNPVGLSYYRIRFRVTLARRTTGSHPEQYAPVLQDLALKFIVRPAITWSWQVRINCRQELDSGSEMTPEQMEDHVISMMESTVKQPFSYGRRATRWVLVSGTQGTESVGGPEGGTDGTDGKYSLTLLEVRNPTTP